MDKQPCGLKKMVSTGEQKRKKDERERVKRRKGCRGRVPLNARSPQISSQERDMIGANPEPNKAKYREDFEHASQSLLYV